MGNLASRQRSGVEELDIHSSSAYRYPPKSGNFFGSHFIMGGEKFDSPQPESFLFGDNSDLNFLGSKPVPFPYPPPQANEPTKTLKSLVNIRRDSLHFTKAKQDPALPEIEGAAKKYNVEFTFDCDVRVSITVHYLCVEELVAGGLVLTPKDKTLASPTYQYRRGAGQVFSQPDHIFSPELHESDLLSFTPGVDMLPVAVHCVADEGEEPRQSHLTIGVVEKQTDGQWALKAIKQKLFVDGLCYLLQEIYGIENKLVEGGFCSEDDDVEDTGAECVVCMSDMRDTLILPCRHLCLCNTCADSLRYQANNCPICRAPFRALLQIRALAKSGHSATHPALAAEAHTDGVPPGYELVSLVEALNGPLSAPTPAVTLTNETQDQERDSSTRGKKKSRRRGSREQHHREKERQERRVSAASAPPPVEEPLPTSQSPTNLVKVNKRKESITIDIDIGETSDQLDLVQEELERAQTELPEVDQEIEATTEDELLKDERQSNENSKPEVTHGVNSEILDDEEDDECEESESCSVSLRSVKHSQSLPATPRSGSDLRASTSVTDCVRTGDSARSSQQSGDSVSSSKHLLSGTTTPKAGRAGKEIDGDPAVV